ncbi:MAG: response regulator, partial [Pseudomonadota bacterium]|nr:response regulator [Pseudomonadota bacterium]
MKPARVLIVDDSASMRALIRATLTADPGVSVVGEAANPLEAREAIKALNPDVMTLDVEMPHMNGLEFLERVMRLRPLPVIMVSSLTERGGSVTISAMEIGAFDYVTKPTPQSPNSFAMLAEKVKAAAGARLGGREAAPARREVRPVVSVAAPNGRAP